MSSSINFKAIKQQTDGTWSTKAVSDLRGFVPSKYYSECKTLENLTCQNQELFNNAKSFEQKLLFSPMRANYLRAFDWQPGDKILEIGCSSGCITRYLAQQGLIIDAIEPNRSLAQLAALQTKDFDQVRVISERFSELELEPETYDVIILNGVTDCAKALIDNDDLTYLNALKTLLTTCKDLLLEHGKLFLTADNRQGLKYIYGATDERVIQHFYGFNGYRESDFKQTLNLSQWRNLITELEFEQAHEYYLFPDFRFTNVILGKDYCLRNEFAFQHLEGVRSKDYFQYQAFGVNEILLYQAANAHGHLGDFANSCLFVLAKNKVKQLVEIDFAHLPSFCRKVQYESIVKKTQKEDFTTRTKLKFEKPTPTEASVESYHKGCQLSVLWRNSVLSDPRGIEFEQLLINYFDFLQKLDSGVIEGMNIDAIANNVIVGDDGKYNLIDCEWLDLDLKIDAGFIFYRAVVHFALRNDSIFHFFNWINHIYTLSDLLSYCFRAVGIDPKLDDFESFRKRDFEFLSVVLHDPEEYQLVDTVCDAVMTGQINPFISWRFEQEYYNQQQKIYCRAKVSLEAQNLKFILPRQNRNIDAIRFFPFKDLRSSSAGFFCVEGLKLMAFDSVENQREIWVLDSSYAVSEANIHQGVFYAEKQGKSVFMFNNNNTFLEFEMPSYELEDSEQLLIEIKLRITPSHDYEIARDRYAFVERQMAEQLRIKDEQYGALSKKHKKLEKELKEIEASRIWRLLEAYRDTFKISGYPEKIFFGKVRHLVNRFRGSKNRLDKDLSD